MSRGALRFTGGLGGAVAGISMVVLVAAIVITHFTRFGTCICALGGNYASAVLMGVPVRRTIISVYALAGLYSALGGVFHALYRSPGYPLVGQGNELSAIAAVAPGGTLLTAGGGRVAGSLFGGVILGSISTLINFNGSLNSGWIMIGGGVLLFIVMQKSLVSSFAFRRTA